MPTKLTLAAAVLVAAGTLSACTDPYDPMQRALVGGGAGAVTGAAIGGLAGGGRGAALGSVIGIGAGALGGWISTPRPAYQQGYAPQAADPGTYYGPYQNGPYLNAPMPPQPQRYMYAPSVYQRVPNYGGSLWRY